MECEKELRLLWPELRLTWNPVALLVSPGCFDAFGLPVPPRYDGRWQVVVKGRLDGEDTVVHTLGAESNNLKPYRAPGPWLIQYMREWDSANRAFVESMQRMYAEAEAEQRTLKTRADEKADEETHRFATNHGAKNHWAVGMDLKLNH